MAGHRQLTDEELKAESQASWTRYRRFIIGLSGMHGEVLAAHLAVEAEMSQRLELLIAHPDVLLERASFSQKLRLLVGLWPGPAPLDGPEIATVRQLNKVRNMIAHGDPDETIQAELKSLLKGLVIGDTDEIAALRGLTMRLCGFLGGITHGIDRAAIVPPV